MQCEGICQLLTVSSVNITVSVKITFGGCKSSTQIIKKNALYSENFYTAGIHFTWPLVATVMTNLNSECLVLFCFFLHALQNIPCQMSCSAAKTRSELVTAERIHWCHRKQNCRGQKVDEAACIVPQQGSLYMFHNKALSAHKSDYCIACCFYMSISDMTDFEKNNLWHHLITA